MKPGNCYIVFLLMLLILAGCSKNEKFSKPEATDSEMIESRFQPEPAVRQETVTFYEAAQDSFQYYLPAQPIERRLLIAANNQLKKSRTIKPRGFIPRTSLNSQEPYFFKAGKTSPEIFFTAIFDNDIFDYTDYYYTNGISLEIYHPSISASPFTQLLPGLKYSINYYGLTLVQNMYTPLKLDKAEIRLGDRPFASYLLIGHQRISLSPESHRRLQSEFSLGVIGPASLGNLAQDLIHDETPVGWVNQVNNDVVVNYSIRFDQGIYRGKGIELAVIGGGQAGTLYNNLMAGVFIQFGKANDRYGSIFQTSERQKPFKKRVRYYFSLDMKNNLVIYDATLQGGMFNRESAYTLNGSQVNRYVFSGTASVGLGFGRYSLEASQVFLTPEFDGGRRHLWFRIKNIIYIN